MENDISWHRRKAPGYRLAVLHRLSAAYLAPRMRDLGLKRAWIAPLLALLETPGQTQDALSRSLRIDGAATARTLFELEGEGYVTRQEDPADRRQKRVWPTPRAEALAGSLEEVLTGHNKVIFRGFSPERRREALEILDTMIANLDSAAGPGGAQDARPGSGHGQA